MFGALFSVVIKHIRRSPIDVVKSNTREAFDFFWAQDDFIDQSHLQPGRLDLYQLVAEYCADVWATRDCPALVRVADIGCGTGHMLGALKAKLGAKCDVQMFGLDFASTAMDKAKRLLPQAIFVAQDIYANSLPSDSFDLVLCIETLEHLRYPEKAVLELLRICKRGGNNGTAISTSGLCRSSGGCSYRTALLTSSCSKMAHVFWPV
jgi:SAM-dependent methyltransferase